MNIFGQPYGENYPSLSSSEKVIKHRCVTEFINLWKYLDLPITEGFREYLNLIFFVKTLPKNYQFNEIGEVWVDVYYILSGYVKVYNSADDNTPIVAALNNGNLIGSTNSLLHDQGSIYRFVAGSNVQAVIIKTEDFYTFMRSSAYGYQFLRFFHLMTTLTSDFLTSLLSILKKESLYKVDYFFEHFPGLANELPDKVIAEILSMKPETMSRCIKELKLRSN